MIAATTRLPARETLIAVPAVILSALLLTALSHRLAQGAPLLPVPHGLWLALHLASVIPALPLGGYILVRRKGDRLHKALGRVWILLMLSTALSSFGLRGMTGGFSWIHLLSILTIVTIPRGIWQAMRGDIARHKRSMTLLYVGLLSAGAFTFVPGRLLNAWLVG